MTESSYSIRRNSGGTTAMQTPSDILQAFEHQWAALVTTYRRDGSGVATPIHLAVEGEHGYFGTASDAGKVKRIRRDSEGQVAACSATGKVTGPTVACRLRMLEGDEAARAQAAIKRKYPIAQGLLVSRVFGEHHAPLSDGYLGRLLARPDFWAFAGMLDGAVAGGLTGHTLMMTAYEGAEVLLYDIAVDPEYQRRGIGR